MIDIGHITFTPKYLGCKLWDGKCGTSTIDVPEPISQSQNQTLHGCKELCDTSTDCGYFEYCPAPNCFGHCGIFSKSSKITTKIMSPGSTCYKGQEPCSVKWAPFSPVYKNMEKNDTYFFLKRDLSWGFGYDFELIDRCSGHSTYFSISM